MGMVHALQMHQMLRLHQLHQAFIKVLPFHFTLEKQYKLV
jgi:hypothetical protein